MRPWCSSMSRRSAPGSTATAMACTSPSWRPPPRSAATTSPRVGVTTRIHTAAPTSAAPGKPAPTTTTSSNTACGTSTSGESRRISASWPRAARWMSGRQSATTLTRDRSPLRLESLPPAHLRRGRRVRSGAYRAPARTPPGACSPARPPSRSPAGAAAPDRRAREAAGRTTPRRRTTAGAERLRPEARLRRRRGGRPT